jgi:hypothetical protein
MIGKLATLGHASCIVAELGCCSYIHRTCLTAVLGPAGLGQLAPLLLLSLVLHPAGCTGSTRLEDERRELSIHPDYLP